MQHVRVVERYGIRTSPFYNHLDACNNWNITIYHETRAFVKTCGFVKTRELLLQRLYTSCDSRSCMHV